MSHCGDVVRHEREQSSPSSRCHGQAVSIPPRVAADGTAMPTSDEEGGEAEYQAGAGREEQARSSCPSSSVWSGMKVTAGPLPLRDLPSLGRGLLAHAGGAGKSQLLTWRVAENSPSGKGNGALGLGASHSKAQHRESDRKGGETTGAREENRVRPTLTLCTGLRGAPSFSVCLLVRWASCRDEEARLQQFPTRKLRSQVQKKHLSLAGW